LQAFHFKEMAKILTMLENDLNFVTIIKTKVLLPLAYMTLAYL